MLIYIGIPWCIQSHTAGATEQSASICMPGGNRILFYMVQCWNVVDCLGGVLLSGHAEESPLGCNTLYQHAYAYFKSQPNPSHFSEWPQTGSWTEFISQDHPLIPLPHPLLPPTTMLHDCRAYGPFLCLQSLLGWEEWVFLFWFCFFAVSLPKL